MAINQVLPLAAPDIGLYAARPVGQDPFHRPDNENMSNDDAHERNADADTPATAAAADQFTATEMRTPGIVRLERTNRDGRLLCQFYGPFDSLFQARLAADRVNAAPAAFGIEPGVTAVAFPLHPDLED